MGIRSAHPWHRRRPARAAVLLAVAGLFAGSLLTASARRDGGSAAAAPTAVESSGRSFEVLPDAPVQGDTLVIIVRAAPGSTVAVHFNGSPVAVFAAGAGLWRALRGTDPDTATGSFPVTATVTPPGASPVTLRRTVTIAPTRFAERHLTLPTGTVALITPKNLAAERDALNTALSRRTPAAMWRGPFEVPVTGLIDSPYGYLGFYNGVREWWHQGVDFPMPAGAPVGAGNNGIVVLARALPLGGDTVIIDHGQGVLTEYLHCSAFEAREGQRVAQGDVIARIGATGLVTGPSLHWGLFAGGHWVNPLFWTSARPGLTAP
ncbi:MAG TPA: M23 family metallopeptidase [bacterium]|nr:M23 family metallopeptidase [bacterium]